MPKVSDEYRSAKREEIATAAMRCLQRQGVSRTTMADIIRESGSSAGSIYSHFGGKAEIARYLTEQIVGGKLIALGRAVAQRGPIDPYQVLEFILSGIFEDDMPMSVVVQIWAESTVDPDLKEVVQDMTRRLRSGFAATILPWALSVTSSDEAASALAERKAQVISNLTQAYILSCALTGADHGPPEFLRGIRGLGETEN